MKPYYDDIDEDGEETDFPDGTEGIEYSETDD